MDAFARLRQLLGDAHVDRLAAARVAVVGVGGVGSHACEALARSGVGSLVLIDGERIDATNINRQIHALHSTIGQPKVAAMAQRIADINPDCRVECYELMYDERTAGEIRLSGCDYVVDCIDAVAAKVLLIVGCKAQKLRIISSMGAGNRTDPTQFRVMDIYDTKEDPLARVMRARLRKESVESLNVVCSLESPKKSERRSEAHRSFPASAAFCVPAAGLLLAREVVMELSLGEDIV